MGNTTVRNELVNVLDTLFRLKQLTRKEYTDITVHLIVFKSRRQGIRRYAHGRSGIVDLFGSLLA